MECLDQGCVRSGAYAATGKRPLPKAHVSPDWWPDEQAIDEGVDWAPPDD